MFCRATAAASARAWRHSGGIRPLWRNGDRTASRPSSVGGFPFFRQSAIRSDAVGGLPFDPGASHDQPQVAPNTLSGIVDRGGPVKLSFFGVPHLARIVPPHIAADNGLRIASLLDLAGTKAAVLQQRAEAKDYIDVDAILRDGRIDLSTALASARYPTARNSTRRSRSRRCRFRRRRLAPTAEGDQGPPRQSGAKGRPGPPAETARQPGRQIHR